MTTELPIGRVLEAPTRQYGWMQRWTGPMVIGLVQGIGWGILSFYGWLGSDSHSLLGAAVRGLCMGILMTLSFRFVVPHLENRRSRSAAPDA